MTLRRRKEQKKRNGPSSNAFVMRWARESTVLPRPVNKNT
ncbi:hypothetical protein LCL96_16130 [Rossellomorea aquimaris]|nr:hypothetical protein [Rossellomorea aquimaris]